MDLIFRLIWSIFSEIQKKDVERRKKLKESSEMSLEDWLQGTPKKESAPQPSKQDEHPRRHVQEEKKSVTSGELTLEEWLNLSQAPQVTVTPQSKLKTKRKKAPATKQQERTQPMEVEATKKNTLVSNWNEAHHKKAQTAGQGAYQLKSKKDPFRLPGKTPLEQMIWAQTVMGPCRANQKKSSRF